MSGSALRAKRVVLEPAHLLRVGSGLDAFRLRARGSGLIISSLGFFRVRGTLDALVYRRLTSGRCRALFLGLHGIAWSSAALPATGRAEPPLIHHLAPPALPVVRPAPSLGVQLTVTAPEPP